MLKILSVGYNAVAGNTGLSHSFRCYCICNITI